MAEGQFANEGAAAGAKPMITVKSGVQEVPFAGGGKTVAQVRNTLKKVLNLGPDMRAYVGKTLIDTADEESTVVPEGSLVEFVKAAGQKG